MIRIPSAERCEGVVGANRRYSGDRCERRGVVVLAGQRYCTAHDPARRAARQRERDAVLMAAADARIAANVLRSRLRETMRALADEAARLMAEGNPWMQYLEPHISAYVHALQAVERPG